MEMFSDEIIGKVAMTTGGFPIGPIVDIVFNREIKYLLVNATSTHKNTYELDDRDRAIIGFNMIKITDKNVVFSK